MIDRWLYTFFGWIDSWFFWVDKQFIKQKKRIKKKKDNNIQIPIKPNSSAITAKIKSVSASGKKFKLA